MDIYHDNFTFPVRPPISVPFVQDDERVKFLFVEIGCKDKKKRRQLAGKKELVYKFWGDNHKHVGWYPEIIRMLVHYAPDCKPKRVGTKYRVNTVVSIRYIPKEALESLTQYDKECIYFQMDPKSIGFPILEDILETADADRLHSFIADGGNGGEIGIVRGKIAEILHLRDLDRIINERAIFLMNGEIKYFNRAYRYGTEVDGIGIFHSHVLYQSALAELGRRDHVVVYEDEFSPQKT